MAHEYEARVFGFIGTIKLHHFIGVVGQYLALNVWWKLVKTGWEAITKIMNQQACVVVATQCYAFHIPKFRRQGLLSSRSFTFSI